MREKEKKRERENLNLGNHITEIPAAQICSQRNQLWQCHCRKWEKKKIVAEIWGGIKKKVLRPQYFYNIFTTNLR